MSGGRWLMAALAATLATGCAGRDLRALCEAAVEASQGDDDIEVQRTRWGILVAGRVSNMGDVRKALDRVEFMEPTAKYPALRESAAVLGHPEWSCPALERLLGPDEE